jgi:hypothetical protein
VKILSALKILNLNEMHFERNRHNTTLWAVKMDITVMD